MEQFQLGIDSLLANQELQNYLRDKRIAFVGHPASVTSQLTSSLDEIYNLDFNLVCGFGPQHGIRGEKQDNMIESGDIRDPKFNIPIYSLYGKQRRPTKEMIDSFDIVLVDLQDVGCRIYTFLTTLIYLLEDLNNSDKEIWILDRPNPAGRPIEGNFLDMKYQSFVGGAPIPMRHGLTLGEFANLYVTKKSLKTKFRVIEMQNYKIKQGPHFGWPEQLAWVNPSPNIPRISCTKTYCGTVLIEGTHLSEGRGTTLPLEVVGAQGFDGEAIIKYLKDNFSDWIGGCFLRPCSFEPTFQKFKGQLCGGLQIHVDHNYDHPQFKAYRLVCAILRACKELYPQQQIFKAPPYEYEETHLPIEILSGSQKLKEFTEGNISKQDFEQYLANDEEVWLQESQEFWLY